MSRLKKTEITQQDVTDKFPEFGITLELSLLGDDFAFVQWHGKKPQKIVFQKSQLESMISLLEKIGQL